MISGGGVEAAKIGFPRDDQNPYVEIIEQPASKALRFRYECEGRSAGSIPGANSTPELKTFPTIRIANYEGHGIVVVSCVTKDHPYRPHPHSLVGKDTCKAGVCRMEITPDTSLLSFVNLGIQCVKKKDICDALQTREDIRVDPYRTGFDHKHHPSAIDLNSVRLCFQAFIESHEGKINVPLRPVVSEPIYDKKAICDLMICKLSHYSATVAGGMEMVILCEKVAKDNIQVRFYEKRDGREVWVGYGDFKSIHVHKQVAIAFRTPSYRNRQIDEPVHVYVQLRRPTDGVTSESLPFKLLPIGSDDHECLKRKRRKFEDNPRAHVLRQIQAEAEIQGALLNKSPCDYNNYDPLILEAKVQSFPIGTRYVGNSTNNAALYGIDESPSQSPTSPIAEAQAYEEQASPVDQSSTAINYAAYNIRFVPSHQTNPNDQFKTAQSNQECQQRQQRQQQHQQHQQQQQQQQQRQLQQRQQQQQHQRQQQQQQQQQQQHQQQQQQLLGIHQFACSQFANYYQQQQQQQQQLQQQQQQQQMHRQQGPVLQKFTLPQQTYQKNIIQDDLDGAVGGTGLNDMAAGHQQFNFDASLNQLDFEDLASLDVTLSETLSSGLSITDHPIKIETTRASGTMPVSVGAAASWCGM